MPDLLIFMGLQASGKSFAAKEYCASHPGTLQVERDQIRLLFNKPFGEDESFVTAQRDAMIRYFLSRGTNVISSDVNLSPKTRGQLERIAKECGAEVWYRFFDTPLAVCLARNSLRPPESFIPESTLKQLHKDCIESGTYLNNIPKDRML